MEVVGMFVSSPSLTSASSSDLDTESTGSFFPDRSTSLGALMGVAVPDRFSSSSQALRADYIGDSPEENRISRRRQRRSIGRRRWWQICHDNASTISLGEFLVLERRLGEAAAGGFVGGDVEAAEHNAVGGVALFENGRVLPPPEARRIAPTAVAPQQGSLTRLPVLIAGICSS